MGGFDTHGGQVQAGNTITGNHAQLLKQVSEAISAFQTDYPARCKQTGYWNDFF